MEIWNRLGFGTDSAPLTFRYVLDNSIKFHLCENICTVNISENDPLWSELESISKVEKVFFTSETRFSKEEFCSAEWLRVRSRWHYDYPQPEEEYTDITYTPECLCPNCGIGLVQKDSFRFKRTPKWGRRNFCTTNWVYDELFTSPRARELLESSDLQGFSFLNVRNKSGKEVLADIYQMQVPYVLPNGMIESESCIAEIFICPVCGGKKYRSDGRGQYVFRREVFENAPDFVKSAELFGGGLIAIRLMFVNQKVYRFIIDHKLDSSLEFEPVRLV